MQVLHGHVSPETAHISFAYPWGFRQRCLHRQWLETATKGGGKGQTRFMTQTTHPTFNENYTNRLNADGEASANEWAKAQVDANLVRWNKPKASTFDPFMLMILAPLNDGTGREGVSQVNLSFYTTTKDFLKFKATYGEQLDAEETAKLDQIERVLRKVNPSSWAEHDAQKVA